MDERIFSKVIRSCLGISNEILLIIGDEGFEGRTVAKVMSELYYTSALKDGLNVTKVCQNAKRMGEEASDETIFALADLPKNSALIVCVSETIGDLKYLGKSFSTFCEKQGHRFIRCQSYGCVRSEDIPSIIASLDIDYGKLREQCQRIKSLFDAGKTLRITTPLGTDLQLNIYGKKCTVNDGFYHEPGRGGSIPAGEVYISLGQKKHHGTIVIDGSIRTSCCPMLVTNPLALTIENSIITSITGREEADMVNKCIQIFLSQGYDEINTLSEFGIGLNPHLLLSSGHLLDEKVQGVCHIGHGNHLLSYNHTFKDATLWLDDEKFSLE